MQCFNDRGVLLSEKVTLLKRATLRQLNAFSQQLLRNNIQHPSLLFQKPNKLFCLCLSVFS
jgi:hypothetical protein